ncbi:MAG TPA: glucose dehydrogenase, partial [Candidatus Dormibacteraeota bacterium]|nr:glucose dehydrogenase [Candidatus Dormibacteraeota bacterium]
MAGCSPVTTPAPVPLGASPSSSAASAPSASPSEAAASILATPSGGRPSPVTPAVASGDPSRVTVALRPVVGGLVAPLLVTGSGDGSGRLFVLEQAGHIRIVSGGRLLARPFLDISG